MKLPPIYICIRYVAREDFAWDGKLQRVDLLDFKQPHFRHGDAVQLRDPFRRNDPALEHSFIAFPILEHDVEGQFERAGVLAANQFRELPKLGHFSIALPMSCETVCRDGPIPIRGWHKTDT